MHAFRDADASIGAELEIEDFAALADDPAALTALQAALDRRAVVRIQAQTPVRAESVAKLAAQLGEPAARGNPLALDAQHDFIQVFRSEPKPDDGRERVRAFIEDLHYDVFANGPAAYAVQILHEAPETVPMRFVDMRAVYESLPDDIRAKIAHARCLHVARAPMDGSRAPATLQPVAARHPRSGAPFLLLANKRDGKLDGLPEDEGRALHADLWARTEASTARYESVMRPNEIYVWDNLACVHDNPAFPRNAARRSWFFNILRAGEIPALAEKDIAA